MNDLLKILELLKTIEGTDEAIRMLRNYILKRASQQVPTPKNFRIYDFCMPDNGLFDALKGVYYKNGEMIASDSHIILIYHNDLYNAQLEGKIVGRQGNIIEGNYPKYEGLIPAVLSPDYHKLEIDFFKMEKWYKDKMILKEKPALMLDNLHIIGFQYVAKLIAIKKNFKNFEFYVSDSHIAEGMYIFADKIRGKIMHYQTGNYETMDGRRYNYGSE